MSLKSISFSTRDYKLRRTSMGKDISNLLNEIGITAQATHAAIKKC